MSHNPTDSDPNPYAPPTVAETEAPSGRYWHVDGIGVMVRPGAILPQVDLETGVSTGELKCVPRSFREVHSMSLLIGVLVAVIYFKLNSYFNLGPGLIFVIAFIYIFLKKIGVIPGLSGKPRMIWSFIEQKRAKRIDLRRRLRIGAMLLVFAAMVGALFLPVFNPSIGSRFFDFWFMWILFPGVALIVAVAVWSMIEGRSSCPIREGMQGWLSISPIHPDALAFLNKREAERNRAETRNDEPVKRRIRTVYYHRYPLRLLIGHRIRNPFAILQVSLMKIFRSKLLVREAYHFSEAEEKPLENLCLPIREAVDSWRHLHPDWTFIVGESFPSPAGDLVAETAILASPGLEHCLAIVRSWMEQTPAKGVTQFRFVTWLADENHVTTHDQPVFALSNPQFHHRASGTPDQVFQAHLRNLSGLVVGASSDIAHLRARLLKEKEETDRLLTEKGLQSEVREVG